jgi:3,4-dihydroxy 2-butanone 4-phosphate synthase/GTP cyclohydrolase II
MTILTNNPKKIVGLEGYGIEVVRRLPLEMAAGEENKGYLMCKRDRMGHLIEVDD